MNDFIDILTAEFGASKPILTEDVLALFPSVSRVTVFKRLKAAVESGLLEQEGRGVYYIPIEDKTLGLGKIPISPDLVIQRKYIKDGDDVFGYYSGLNLENQAGVSTQVPGTLEITTNKTARRVKEVSPYGGYRKITLRKPRTKVTCNNVDALMFLDLITNVSLPGLNNWELSNLKDLADKVGRKKAMEYIQYYPDKTYRKLAESERFGVFA